MLDQLVNSVLNASVLSHDNGNTHVIGCSIDQGEDDGIGLCCESFCHHCFDCAQISDQLVLGDLNASVLSHDNEITHMIGCIGDQGEDDCIGLCSEGLALTALIAPRFDQLVFDDLNAT